MYLYSVKKIFSLYLLICYTLLAISFSVSVSYCGEKIIDIKFFSDTDYCCGKPKKCCKKVKICFELQENARLSEPNSCVIFPKFIVGFIPKFFDNLQHCNFSDLNNQIKFSFPIFYTNIPKQKRFLLFCSLKIGDPFFFA